MYRTLHTTTAHLLLAIALAGCGARTLNREEPDGGARRDAPAQAAPDAGPCGPVRVQCGGLCIDPQRDAEFCGAADPCTGDAVGTACQPQQACVAGRCQRICPAGRIACQDACIDPATDDAFCGAGNCGAGAVGVACEPAERCRDGACVPRCEPGLLSCGIDCVDPLRDRDHCGARVDCEGPNAGQACEQGQLCISGACAANCPAGQVECGGRCIDPYTDRDHCGALPGCAPGAMGVACADGELCALGLCELACPPELLRCGPRCIDPDYDAQYCGADGDCRDARAGTPCAADQYCDDGRCRAQCPAGQLSCEGGCTDPQSDPAHCGAADDCEAGLGGTQCAPGDVCAAGRCVDDCPPATIECERGCIDPATSRAHCGGSGDCMGPLSGTACRANEACVAGVCVSSCGGELRRCDGLCTDVLHDRAHCGGCDSACGPGMDCFDGLCAQLCPPGPQGAPPQLLCDGQCVDPSTDGRHCGASGLCVGIDAGQACEEAERCVEGQCDPICEGALCAEQCIDIAVNPAHCGGCNRGCVSGTRCSDGDCLCVVHVRPGGDDAAAGSAWGNAKRSLVAALTAAHAGGCAVWVAEGRYPVTDDGDPGATLVLGAGTRMYGGFVGDETRLDARDIPAHPTYLSGALGDPNDTSDNSRTLLTCVGDLGCDAQTVVDGFVLEAALGRAMHIEGAAPSLRSTVLRDNLGGGLRIVDGSPSIEGCRFEGNYAQRGAGIEVLSGEARIESTLFAQNVAAQEGGGLYIAAAARPELIDARFVENFARLGGGLWTDDTVFVDGAAFEGNRAIQGGGIHGPVVVHGTTMQGNEADAGGGIYSTRAVSLSASHFADNVASNSGGAIRLWANQQAVMLSVDRCSWDNNGAVQGGAIHYEGAGQLLLDNSALWSNEAAAGAAILVRGGLRVGTTTFAGNRAGNQFGSAIEQSAGNAGVENSILWDNGPVALRLAPGQGLTHHCLIDGGCTTSRCGAFDAILDADPRLASAPSGDLRLLPTSPCIDRGDNAAVPGSALLDLSGRARILDGPDADSVATVDLGAYEYAP